MLCCGKRVLFYSTKTAPIDAFALLNKYHGPSPTTTLADIPSNNIKSTEQPSSEAVNRKTIDATTQSASSVEKIYIPTVPPPDIKAIPDISIYFTELKSIYANNASQLKPSELEFMDALVDTVVRNPSFDMSRKKQAITLANDFFQGKAFDNTVNALEGTDQQKTIDYHAKKNSAPITKIINAPLGGGSGGKKRK